MHRPKRRRRHCALRTRTCAVTRSKFGRCAWTMGRTGRANSRGNAPTVVSSCSTRVVHATSNRMEVWNPASASTRPSQGSRGSRGPLRQFPARQDSQMSSSAGSREMVCNENPCTAPDLANSMMRCLCSEGRFRAASQFTNTMFLLCCVRCLPLCFSCFSHLGLRK